MRQGVNLERIPIPSKRDVLRSTLESAEFDLEVAVGVDVLGASYEDEARVLADTTWRKSPPIEASDLMRLLMLRIVEDPVDPRMLHAVARFEHVA